MPKAMKVAMVRMIRHFERCVWSVSLIIYKTLYWKQFMKDYKSLSILGRQPALGLAELESLYGAEHLKPIGQAVLLDIPAGQIDFRRLGGTIKTARILNSLPYADWPAILKYLKQNIPRRLKDVPAGKFTLGISSYGLNAPVPDINKGL